MAPELYEFDGETVVAKAGTGFNEFSRQHSEGSDSVRLAIWVQMARDKGDWARADEVRDMARLFGYSVGTTAGKTHVALRRVSVKKHAAGRLGGPRLVQEGGIIYDGVAPRAPSGPS